MKSQGFIFTILMGIFPLFACHASYQWQQTNGPQAGLIKCSVISGNQIYLGTHFGGIFTSVNNGSSWSTLNNGLYTLGIISGIAINGSTLFATDEFHGVYRSLDGGASWSVVNNGLTGTALSVYSLLMKNNLVFIGTYSGIYISSDMGASWTLSANGIGLSEVDCLALIGNNIFAGTPGGGVYLLVDNGNSWSPVNTGLTNLQIKALAVMGSNLFAGTWGGGVFLSANNGASWTSVNTGLTDLQTVSLAAGGGWVFAGSFQGHVFRSSNNGTSWAPANNGLPGTEDFTSLTTDGTIVVGGDWGNGVFVSMDHGASWIPSNNGLINSWIYALFRDGNNIYCGSQIDGGYRTADNGNNWTRLANGLVGDNVISFMRHGNNLYCGADLGLYVSTNNGLSWSTVYPYLYGVISMASLGNDIFISRGTQGVWRSSDNGITWTQVFSNSYFTSMDVLAVFGSNLLVGTMVGLFLSSDHGNSWTLISSSLPNAFVTNIAIMGNTIFIATNTGVYKSGDAGATWIPANNGLGGNHPGAFAVKGDTIWCSPFKHGVYVSFDYGGNWSGMNTGLLDTIIGGLVAKGDTLYASTESQGVWRFPLCIPATITGPDSMCVNSGYYTYTTEPGNSGYAWTISPGGNITYGQGTCQAQVTWNTGGAKWIHVSHDSTVSQCPSSFTRLVTVRALPGLAGTISGPTSVCAGDNGIVYSIAPVPGATVYVWTIPPGVIIASGAGTDSITVDFTPSATSGNITVLGNNTCGNGDTASLSVAINPVPPSPLISFVNDTLFSSALLGNQWYLNGAPIPGATLTFIPVPPPGEYWCSVILNGCASDTSNHILVLPEMIIRNGSPDFLVYPNPADDRLCVFLPLKASLSVLDLQGKEVKTYSVPNGLINLDISSLSSGFYFLKTTTEKGSAVKKFLKR